MPLVPPVEPGPEDCCGNMCVSCVWEQYYDAKRQYEAEQERRKAVEQGGNESDNGKSPENRKENRVVTTSEDAEQTTRPEWKESEQEDTEDENAPKRE